MGILKEAKVLLKSVLSWVYVFLGLAFFLFTFGIREAEIAGRAFLIPQPGLQSFANHAFELMRQALVPAGVELIVTNPLSAFMAQLAFALMLAFVLTFPYLLYRIVGYLAPALLAREKKALLLALLPASLLFFAGSAFAYFFVIPATFAFLYPYTLAVGAVPYFAVGEFVALTFGIMVAVGVMFLLPVFMALLNYSGLASPGFWTGNWRYAAVFFLVFSAIITPDGTGISMLMLAGPLVGLYAVGAMVGKRNTRKN